MNNDLYEVKSLLTEATQMENTAYDLLKQNKPESWADSLIRKAIHLELKAEAKYYEIVGAYLHHKELKDLFGIQ